MTITNTMRPVLVNDTGNYDFLKNDDCVEIEDKCVSKLKNGLTLHSLIFWKNGDEIYKTMYQQVNRKQFWLMMGKGLELEVEVKGNFLKALMMIELFDIPHFITCAIII